MKSFVLTLAMLAVTAYVFAQDNTQKQLNEKGTTKPASKPAGKQHSTPIPTRKLTISNGEISFKNDPLRLQCLRGDYDPLKDE